MNKQGLYQKDEIKSIFNIEKSLFGSDEGVARYRAIELFGKEAVIFAQKMYGRGLSNGYGVGDYTADYFTYAGIETIATYLNCRTIQRIEAEKGGAVNE